MKLSSKELQEILSNWNIGEVLRYSNAEKGEVNHNWIVKTKRGKFVLRKVSKYKQVKDLNFEFTYLNYLKNKGFPYRIPTPFLTVHKRYYMSHKNLMFWLYKFIEGKIIEKFRNKELAQVAKMMAQYHKIIESIKLYNGKPKAEDMMKNVVAKELRLFQKRILKAKIKKPFEKIFMKESEILMSILKRLDTKEYSKLKKYPIHRDLNPENLLWKNGKLTGIIDFDNVSQINDACIKDVAITLQYACSGKEHKLNVGRARFFIRAYKKHRAISNKEIALIPSIIIAGFIEDFSYCYWMVINDSKRAKPNRLKRYSNTAKWYYENLEKISRELKK